MQDDNVFGLIDTQIGCHTITTSLPRSQQTEVSRSFHGHNCWPLRQDVTWLCVFSKELWFISVCKFMPILVYSGNFPPVPREFLICPCHVVNTTARGWKFQAALRLSREMSIAKRKKNRMRQPVVEEETEVMWKILKHWRSTSLISPTKIISYFTLNRAKMGKIAS